METMHHSAERLYAAVAALRGITGQSAVARLLNVSPQALGNWETRGISTAGAIAVEALLGVPAHWLLTGDTPPGASDPLMSTRGGAGWVATETEAPYSTASVRQTLDALATHLTGSDSATRGSAAPLLAKLAESPELAPRLIRALEALLADPQVTGPP